MDDVCPLCAEDIDEEEKHFRPCKCGFTICVWCFQRLIDLSEDGRANCPHCRRPYPKTAAFQAPPKPVRTKGGAGKDKKKAGSSYSPGNPLSAVRLRPPTLVYVTGLPAEWASNPTHLRSHWLFGQYGHIVELRVMGKASSNTATAMIEFSTEEEAALAIAATNTLVFKSEEVSASYGVSRYCAKFIANDGTPCTKDVCLDVHHELPEKYHISTTTTATSHSNKKEEKGDCLALPELWRGMSSRYESFPSVDEVRKRQAEMAATAGKQN